MASLLFFMVAIRLATGAATPVQPGRRASAAVPPKQDPWYNATDGFEGAELGSVLRVRQAPGDILTIFSLAETAYNLLYRSTDSRGLASWAVTTILSPRNAVTAPDGSSALLSYQIDYDSANLDASPSYILSTVSLFNGGGHGPDQLIYVTDIQKALGNGWYVTVPDYEGPLAAFSAGLQAGYATLDGIRATLSAAVLGLPENTSVRTGMCGYSGGALASEWAAELQSEYAPELNISGVALGGLVPSTYAVTKDCSNGPLAGLGPSGIVGLVSQFPEVAKYIVSKLKTDGSMNANKFFSVRNMTLNEALVEFSFQNIFDYFIGGEADLENPIFQNLTDEQGKMGYHGTPIIPMYIYKALNDDVSDISETDALVDKYCAAGVHIEYERNLVGNHVTEQYTGDIRAFKFLDKVLQGTYIQPKTCSIKNVTWQ